MTWARSAVVTAVVAVAVLAQALPSGALTLVTIRGVVADAAGRPVADAQVTDGSTYVTTDASGHYEIEEDEISSQVIVVTKTGFDPASRLVTPTEQLTPVDFTLMHGVNSTTSPRAFNNSPAKTLTITAKSYAPTSDSCLSWTDSATGTVVSLSVSQAVAGGESTWSGSFAVPASSADGSYTSTTRLTHCPSSTALAAPRTWTYIIDSVVPSITGLLPVGFSNTLYASQPLSARVADSRSGIDPASIQFLLRDLTAGTNTTLGAAAFTSDVAQTAAAALTDGHIYSIRVSASDYAGNSKTVDQGTNPEGAWRAITASVGTSSFEFQPRAGTIGGSLNSDGTRTATFPNVQLASGSASLTFSSSQHLGDGMASYGVPLLPIADVCTEIGGVETCLPVSNTGGDPNWSDKAVAKNFDVGATGSQTLTAPASATNIGTLTARILPAWQNVTLKTRTPQSRAGAFLTCLSPLAGGAWTGCNTDPVGNARMDVSPPAGTIISTAPFTFRTVKDDYTVTQSFNESSTGNMVGVLTIAQPDGTTIRVDVTGVKNADGTTTLTGTSPNTSEVFSQTISASSDTCWPCVAAAGIASFGAGIACIFASPFGCAVAWGGATAASTAYCANNPCQPSAPSCTLNTNVSDQGANQYYRIFANNYASCSKSMNNLAISARIYRNGSLWYNHGSKYCYNQYSCYNEWIYHDGVYGGNCYQAYVTFTGEWKDPSTNQWHYFSEAKYSNNLCM